MIPSFFSDELPSVGKPPEKPLYKQGSCLICGIALFGYEKRRRNFCGHETCQTEFEKKYSCKRLTGPRVVEQVK